MKKYDINMQKYNYQQLDLNLHLIYYKLVYLKILNNLIKHLMLHLFILLFSKIDSFIDSFIKIYVCSSYIKINTTVVSLIFFHVLFQLNYHYYIMVYQDNHFIWIIVDKVLPLTDFHYILNIQKNDKKEFVHQLNNDELIVNDVLLFLMEFLLIEVYLDLHQE